MSFKFNFDLEDEDDDQVDQTHLHGSTISTKSVEGTVSETSKSVWDEKSHTVTLDELLDTLPSRILYSPIPLPFQLSQPILRRDLHDARFQLASTFTITDPSPGPSSSSIPDILDASSSSKVETGRTEDGGRSESEKNKQERDQGESYVSAGAGTDLIPGLYEGGLKTWEGGLDLVEVLSGGKDVGDWIKGSGVLEVGCGTALPSAYILSRLLDSSSHSTSTNTSADTTKPTRILLQDYNLPVLTLVSLPNLLLAALPYLPITSLEPVSFSSEPTSDPEENLIELKETDNKPDWSIPGELEITPSLKEAFKSLLSENRIELGFRYGGWKGFSEEIKAKEERFRLVISAETIYSEGSVGDLISVLRVATVPSTMNVGVKEDNGEDGDGLGMDGLSVKDHKEDWGKTDLRKGGSVVLIAAKVLYFGVGGGIQNFLSRVETEKGWWVGVKEWTKGVGRKVVRIGWVN